MLTVNSIQMKVFSFDLLFDLCQFSMHFNANLPHTQKKATQTNDVLTSLYNEWYTINIENI